MSSPTKTGGGGAGSFLGRPRIIPPSASQGKPLTLPRNAASCRRDGSSMSYNLCNFKSSSNYVSRCSSNSRTSSSSNWIALLTTDVVFALGLSWDFFMNPLRRRTGHWCVFHVWPCSMRSLQLSVFQFSLNDAASRLCDCSAQ